MNVKILLSLAVTTTACGGTTTSLDISQPPIRTGGQLESIPINYYDLAPSLNDDGTRVVFVSGRDTTAEGAQLRVYRASWPAGKAPAKPERVTTEDLGLEEFAIISPDGSTVAMIIAQGNVGNVYTIPFTGGDTQPITTDGGELSRLQFSEDGEFLAWMKSDGTSRVAYVGDTAGNAVEALTAVDVHDVFWIPTEAAGSYRLGVTSVGKTSGLSQLQVASFSDVETAASAEMVDLGEPFIGADQNIVASDDWIMVGRRLMAAEKQSIARLGNFSDTKPEDLFKSRVENVPSLRSVTEGDASEFDSPLGDAVTSFNLVGDGMHFLSRNSYRCDGDQNVGFVWTMTSASFDGSTVTRRYPRLSQTGTWEQGDICERTDSQGQPGKIDEMVTSLTVAGGGSLQTFRAAYVSRFSEFKDRNCRLKAGDPEVRLIEVGDTDAIYELSENPYGELKDTPRGEDGPCP